MSRTEKECCDDEKLLEQITGGTREQVQEIYDYVRIDDPEGYAAIIASPYPSDWMMLRYLNDHGVPLVGFSERGDKDNIYVFGDRDTQDYSSGVRVSHEEVMRTIRMKIR